MDTRIKPLALLLVLVSVLLVVQVALSATILRHLARLEAGHSLEAGTDQAINPEPSVPRSNSQEVFAYVKEASVGDAFVRGDPSAPVTIIEFSDFQCPFCNQAYLILKQLLQNYQGKIKLAYRHYPLASHEYAYLAALAAEAAGEQGKFWEMHDLLFESVAKEGPTAR
ncbi:MAG: DsbA family protein [Hydrogenibacillus schlegelii]|uniref:DsbA family protein n=1 Tax=Hydrogenibacillus schlegelii TaxID=1484 RepID=A0A947CYA0_HYDSH|nr:DsbA family protein [Hydrogenibacillus schlegelii]